MSRDAAKRFRELVAAGEEIPYDIRESGDGSPLPQYVPLTERFVRDHASVLRELDSFGSACAAIEAAELAGPYLEDNGIAPPSDARRRAELAGVVFLARMWMDSTDFSLDDERLRASISELEANADANVGEIEIVVPLRGLRMEGTRIDLATGTIVRADTVDVPAEARASEASGGAGWEPTFLAAARVHANHEDEDDEPGAGTRTVAAFREMITALRLFKAGGVALGPHAWTRAGSGRWRRISTGAGRPRPGGYRLAETELGALAAFSRGIRSRPGGEGSQNGRGGLARAISRFEAGLERTVAIDALNDHLLALRFLLEGGGPAELGLAMRVASLCAEPDQRSEVKSVIDQALALERELWSGEPPAAQADDASPAETALAVEELARAILKDAACGHLGADLRATADEILLADGLAVGDGATGQRGETAEWSAGEDGWEEANADVEAEAPSAGPDPVAEPAFELSAQQGSDPSSDRDPLDRDPLDATFDWQSLPLDHTRMPTATEEPRNELDTDDGPRYGRFAPVVPDSDWNSDSEPEMKVIREPARMTLHRNADEKETQMIEADTPQQAPPRIAESGGPVARLLALHSVEREATASRVANLFPAPETTEWSVREIAYDRTRRSQAAS